MDKEKQVKTYQRRGKNGKMVTVKQHTSKYKAGEESKSPAKKKGAGEELTSKKKEGHFPMVPDSEWGPFLEYLGDASDNADVANASSRKQAMNILKREGESVALFVKGWGKKRKEYIENYSPKTSSSTDMTKAPKGAKATSMKEAKTERTNAKASKDEYDGKISSQERSSIEAKSSPSAKSKVSAPPSHGISQSDFKEWYNGTGSAVDKKVGAQLRKAYGRAEYKKMEDNAIDNYTARGHSKMFKGMK